jgi:hypothetical protein
MANVKGRLVGGIVGYSGLEHGSLESCINIGKIESELDSISYTSGITRYVNNLLNDV